jgi:hypothetical protein
MGWGIAHPIAGTEPFILNGAFNGVPLTPAAFPAAGGNVPILIPFAPLTGGDNSILTPTGLDNGGSSGEVTAPTTADSSPASPILGPTQPTASVSAPSTIGTADLSQFGFLHPGQHGLGSSNQGIGLMAPDSFLSRHGANFASLSSHRQAGMFGAAFSQSNGPCFLHFGQGNRHSATGLAGSLSPTMFVGSQSPLDPSAALQTAGSFAPDSSAMPSPLDSSGGIQRVRFVSGSSAGAADASTSDGAAVVTITSASGDGGGAPSGALPSGSGSGGSGGSTQDDHVSGSFTFTLTESGAGGSSGGSGGSGGSSGAFTLIETGTGTFADDNVNGVDTLSGTLTFSISLNGQTSQGSLSIDPNGQGLLLGFDLDGYNRDQLGIDRLTASSYVLDAIGSDHFTDNDTDNHSTTDSKGMTTADGITYSDIGDDTSLHLHMEGNGQLLHLTWDDTASYTYHNSDAGSQQIGSDTEALNNPFLQTDDSPENRPAGNIDHEEGDIGPDGVFHLTSFNVDDTLPDSFTSSDGGNDTQNSPGDSFSDTFNDWSNGSLTEHIVVSGTGDNWTVSFDDVGNSLFGYGDIGSDNSNTTSSNGEVSSDNASFNDSGNGHANFNLHIDGNGQGDQFQPTSMTIGISGGSDFTEGETDNLGDTQGADESHDVATTNDGGHDDFNFQVTSSDGQTMAVTTQETINDWYNDSDLGGDSWDDPSTTSTGAPDDEHGSDTYSDSDNGNETDQISSGGTIDASGNLQLTTLNVDIGGSAGVTADDGGTDSLDAGSDDDTDNFWDHQDSSDAYHYHLSGDPNAPTLTTDETITGNFNDGDTDTAHWDDPFGGGEDSGTDVATDSDHATETIVVHSSGAFGTTGGYSETGGSIDITGHDGFTATDHITDNSDPPGPDHTNTHQDDGLSGGDDYQMHVARTAGGGLTITDDETIGEQSNIDATLDATATSQRRGGTETDQGSGELSGPVNGHVHQGGHTQGGSFVTDPASGNLNVNLNGDCHNDDVLTIPGGDTFLPFYGVPHSAAILPIATTIEVVIDDPSFHLNESDGESASVWTPGSIGFSDAPTLTTTTTYYYGIPAGLLDSEKPATASGTDVFKHTVQMTVSENGSGAQLHAKRTETTTDTEQFDVSWDCVYSDGQRQFNSKNTTIDTIEGGRAVAHLGQLHRDAGAPQGEPPHQVPQQLARRLGQLPDGL